MKTGRRITGYLLMTPLIGMVLIVVVGMIVSNPKQATLVGLLLLAVIVACLAFIQGLWLLDMERERRERERGMR